MRMPAYVFPGKTPATTDMKTGLVLGKFLPLHKGHIALVGFALHHCDRLIILLCASAKEPIAGATRKHWIMETFGADDRVAVTLFEYNEEELPNTSVSSPAVSEKWARYIGQAFPGLDIFFSSEPYGKYVARFLNIEYKIFDQERKIVPISASAILYDPFKHWDFIAPAARPWFVKKICISGSESTGKSTLAEKLALHFNTSFVPEMAREVIGKTEEVVFDDLLKIATLHAKTIIEKTSQANKLLICDTDLNITKSYAEYLFNRQLDTPQWIDDANNFALHIFLETDCPYVQDGTRLSLAERNRLEAFHKKQLQTAGISYTQINGSWEERFEKAKAMIEKTFFNK
jgi:HTH-type transcriptional regulator, transcriptional repressor of NAD biosynthesis genes